MTPRKLLSIFALIVLTGVIAYGVKYFLDHPEVLPPDDYVEYWAAGNLQLQGKNPYSAEELLPLQRFAGRDTDEAIMMWNPPWTLCLAMPLGALPARVGQLVWFALSFAAVGVSAWLCWSAFRGPNSKLGLPLLLALSFLPTLFVLQSGQISGFLLLGAALFLWCVRRGFHFGAGAAAVLLAAKPHLAFLLWFAVGLDAVVNRRWRIVLGGVVVGALAGVFPVLFNANVWADFFEAYRSSPVPPSKWVSLTLGAILRLAYGPEHFWLQFVPTALVTLGFAVHWFFNRMNWDWIEEFPSLLLCSFVASPYGAWHFDLILLLIPAFHRAAAFANEGWTTRNKTGLILFAGMNVAMFAMTRFELTSFCYCWVASLTLLGYAFTGVRTQPRAAVQPA